jgi:hypothetical protein
MPQRKNGQAQVGREGGMARREGRQKSDGVHRTPHHLTRSESILTLNRKVLWVKATRNQRMGLIAPHMFAKTRLNFLRRRELRPMNLELNQFPGRRR